LRKRSPPPPSPSLLTDLSVGNLTQALATVNVAPATFTLTIPAATTPPVPVGAAVGPRRYGAIGSSTELVGPAPRAAAGKTDGTSPATVALAVLVALGVLSAGAAAVRSRRRPHRSGPTLSWATGPAPGTAPSWPPDPFVGSWQHPTPDTHAPAPEAHPPQKQTDAGPALVGTTEPAPAEEARPVQQVTVAGEPTSEAAEDPIVVTGTRSRPVVRVMGPVTVEGWSGERPRLAAVVDLVVYLACHSDRPVTADRLRAALSGPDADLSEPTLRSYGSLARRALGAEHLPPAGEHGYQLVDVDLDWTNFQALVAEAATLPAYEGRTVLDQALRLVRGRAFPNPARWADLENLPDVIDRAVTTTAGRLAGLHLDAGELAAALAAAELGLDITPTDLDCAVAAIGAAAQTGRLTPTWKRISRAWAEADLALPSELTDLRRRLAHVT
jgi:hypothetical protein